MNTNSPRKLKVCWPSGEMMISIFLILAADSKSFAPNTLKAMIIFQGLTVSLKILHLTMRERGLGIESYSPRFCL